MKIYAILDHTGYNKTLLGVVEKWKEQGHEVKTDMYYDIEKANWCDVIFCEYIQGGAIHACKDEGMKKPIVMRGIDIDLYYGHYLGVDWNRCKAILFINDYMREYIVDNYVSTRQIKLECAVETVNLGVDLDKWTYKGDNSPKTKKIGWLNAFWSGKGVGILTQIIYNLIKKDSEYQFEIVGNCPEPWLEKYFIEFLKRNGLENNVKRIKSVVSVDEWLNDKDYILSTSMKECMSMPLIEAMAKGIKPIIHHWWDAKELYPEELVFETVDEAVNLILEDKYDSRSYRKFVEDRYDLNMQVNKLNKVLGI